MGLFDRIANLARGKAKVLARELSGDDQDREGGLDDELDGMEPTPDLDEAVPEGAADESPPEQGEAPDADDLPDPEDIPRPGDPDYVPPKKRL